VAGLISDFYHITVVPSLKPPEVAVRQYLGIFCW